jgi:hypothetical protein
MLRTMGIIPVLLTVAVLPALATPVYYTIDFSLIAGTPAVAPTSGSFDYDASTQTFTGFSVVWNGLTYDMTAAANAPTIFGPYGAPACIGGLTGGAASFQLLTGCQSAPSLLWTAGDCCSYNGILPAGSFGFDAGGDGLPSMGILASGTPSGDAVGTFAIAPEPGTVVLTLIGLGLIVRRRVATYIR